MSQKILHLFAANTLLLFLLSGCGGYSEIRATEGSGPSLATSQGSAQNTREATTIVHVDAFERLATLRNARSHPAGTFLETRDSAGNKTAILKTRENRESGLRTADILEGIPKINNRAAPVDDAESKRLSKIYRDPVE